LVRIAGPGEDIAIRPHDDGADLVFSLYASADREGDQMRALLEANS
jgi:hypothetical protein